MSPVEADGYEFATTTHEDNGAVLQPEGPGWLLVDSHATPLLLPSPDPGRPLEWSVVWSFLWTRRLSDG